MLRWSARAGLGVVAGLLALAGLLVVSDEAEATHFWSGSLSWERVLPEEASELLGADAAVRITGYLSFDSTPAQFGVTGCNKAVGEVIPSDKANTAFLYVGDVPYDYVMKVAYSDPLNAPLGHCRFAAKILDPSQVATELGVIVPLPPAGGPIPVWWGRAPADTAVFCCREDGTHINNPDPIAAVLGTILTPGNPNSSPVIDFPRITPFTSHGANGYGNHHCPKDSFCNFYIYASDPDNDTLTWRKATSDEASAGTLFKHPGPPWTGPLTVDGATGLVTWDTTGASVGEIYSTQIIVEDNDTKVPVDFMVEIGPGCENGATGVIDPVTGELICEKDVPDPPVDPPCTTNPDGDGCRPVPPKPPEGKEYQHHFWPPPQRTILVQPAASDSQALPESSKDGLDETVSKLDSDGDDVDDRLDLCPGTEIAENGDTDRDGRGDGCDPDDDNDGILDELDACPDDPDPRCGLEAAGKHVADGRDAAQGFLAPTDPLERSRPAAPVQEAAAEVASAWPLLAGLGAAMLLLLLVGARRRDDDDRNP